MSMTRLAAGLGVVAVVGGALIWALRPQPVGVDLAEVIQGRFEVTITSEGTTRVRDPHTITAPFSGTTTRAPVQVGDRVVQGETVVAVLQPADPGLMDSRTRAQAEAAVAEAQAAVHLSDANLERARTALDHARTQLERGEGLAQAGTIPGRMLEDLAAAFATAGQALAAAQAERELALATLRRAEAQLLGPETEMTPNGATGECCVRIRAPLDGIVLDVPDRNARQVMAGAPLVTLGDLRVLDIETDILSGDAVQLVPGMVARISRWGGAGVLQAEVRRVEPAAFTRVSALGIEEQRVRVHLDLRSPLEARPGLGDRYRVIVDLVLRDEDGVIQVPHGALFRHAGGWAVFRHDQGRAVLTPVTPGQRATDRTEVLVGLAPGEAVVLFPPGTLKDDDRIAQR